jgi:hypothetical protein
MTAGQLGRLSVIGVVVAGARAEQPPEPPALVGGILSLGTASEEWIRQKRPEGRAADDHKGGLP